MDKRTREPFRGVGRPSSNIKRLEQPMTNYAPSLEDLSAVQIKNFKSIVNETINFDQATFISGFNSAGKSSFSHALLLILQWLGSLTSAQPSKIPINGPLIQLGNNALSMLNRSVSTTKESSSKENQQPFEVTLIWGENSFVDFQNITFKLSADLSSKGYFDLEEVMFHQSTKTEEDNNVERIFKYKISNEELIDQNVTSFFGKYVSSSFEDFGDLKAEQEINRINEELIIDKQIYVKFPYYQTISKNGKEQESVICFFPNNVKITDSHKPFDTGLTKDPSLRPLIRKKETSVDNSLLIPRDDAFRFLIFKNLCKIINEVPQDIDITHKLSEQILSLKLDNISKPLTSSKQQLDEKLNFDNRQSLLYSVAESLRPFTDDFGLLDKLENHLGDEEIPNKLDSIPINNENEYIDANNLKEIVSLSNISPKKSLPFEIGRVVSKTMRPGTNPLTAIFNNTFREFQPDFLARTLFTDKEHLSVDEGDAWSDEFRDLLDARLDVSIFLEPVKENINDEVDETEPVRIPRALKNYNKNIRIERGIKEAFIEYLLPNNPENKTQYVYEPYEKEHQLTPSLPEKISYAFKLFQKEFLEETKNLSSEIDEISDLHSINSAKEFTELNDKIKHLQAKKTKIDKEIASLRNTREELENFVIQDKNSMADIEKKYEELNEVTKKIDNLNKRSLKTNRSIASFEEKMQEFLSKQFVKTNEIDFGNIYNELNEFVDKKSKNILNNILNSQESEIKKLENYVFLKLIVPPFDSGESRKTQNFIKEYQNFYIRKISKIELNESTSSEIKSLIDSKKLILFKEEQSEKSRNRINNSFDVTLLGGSNEFFNSFNYLSSTRNLSRNNIEGFYGGSPQSPLGSNAEYLTNFLNINGEEEYIAPLPQKHLDSLEQKGLKSTSPYLLTLNQHINIWSSFIFNQEIEIGIDENSGLTLMIGDDAIQNVGSGVSQVLPIITQLIVSENNFILLEEAEQNLHPEAQANLADMIITFSQQRRTILVETHSDHLINRIRLRMITDEIQPGAKIYFAEIEGQNGTKLKEMQINDKGEFIMDKIPDGFFDQPQKDTLKIIKAIRDKK